MKKRFVALVMLLLFMCTACSNDSSAADKKMAFNSSDGLIEAERNTESEGDAVLTSILTISDYEQYCARYQNQINKARMSIGIFSSDSSRDFACILQPDGTLWLRSYVGEVEFTKLMDDVAAFSESNTNVCAVKNDGSLWSWEFEPFYGERVSDKPVHIMDNVISVYAGWYMAMAIDADGGLWTWGQNACGILGDGTTENRSDPVKIMDNVSSVTIAGSYAMAIKRDGSLWAWGDNTFGQLGDGTTKEQHKPVKILDDVVSASTDQVGTSMALRSDSSLWAWGIVTHNDWIYSTKESIEKHNPVKVFDDVISFSIASSATLTTILAAQSDGSLWGWGSNVCGQLGIGNEDNSAEPIHIMDDIAYVSGFPDLSVMVVGNDGSIWTWGKGVGHASEFDYDEHDNSEFTSIPRRIDLDDNGNEENFSSEASEQSGEGIFSYDTTVGFSQPLEYYYQLSGLYEGSTGQSSLSISIYSSQGEEETEIGNVWMYVDGEQYYLGMIIAEQNDVYLVESDTGEEVVLNAYTYEGTIVIDLYVDGQYIDTYTMVEHYVS